MALSFILFYTITRIVKSVIEKQKQKKRNYAKIPNPKGGSSEIEGTITDESELGLAILSCIADEHSYIVKHPKIIRLVFNLVMRQINDESLKLTPNMMRYLAMRLLKKDQTIIAIIGNVLLETESQSRFFARIGGAAFIGAITGFFGAFQYSILLSMLYFFQTENCFRSEDYFQKIPNDQVVKLSEEIDSGHLVITDENKQVEIYTSSKKEVEINTLSTGETQVTKTYNKVPKKAKQVTFSEFKEQDPVLSTFHDQDLQEPIVKQKACLDSVLENADIMEILAGLE